jgi:hypothetical protein
VHHRVPRRQLVEPESVRLVRAHARPASTG